MGDEIQGNRAQYLTGVFWKRDDWIPPGLMPHIGKGRQFPYAAQHRIDQDMIRSGFDYERSVSQMMYFHSLSLDQIDCRFPQGYVKQPTIESVGIDKKSAIVAI